MKVKTLLLLFISFSLTGAANATPTRITNLTAVINSPTSVMLSFTMPTPGAGLTLSDVECREGGVSITTFSWSGLSIVSTSPDPASAGTIASFNVTVVPGVTKNFACKTKDTVWSAVSNVVSVKTTSSTQTVSLAWDAVVHNEVIGYKMYIGDYSGTYASSVLLGLTTSTSLSLPLGPHCYVVHSRSNTTESGPSNEVCTP